MKLLLLKLLVGEKISKVVFIALLALTALPPIKGWCVSPPVALLAGVAFAWLMRPVFPRFSKATQKFLLQAAVVGLGFGMNVEDALKSGKDGMMFTIVSVVVVMLAGWALARLMRVDKKTGYLISAGTAICGGSAIAAVAPITRADDDQMSVSLGTVFLLNALALIIFPPLGHAFGLGDVQFGEWAAIAIHDTSSVVGAGAAYSDKALEVAAMVKLTRALWILPLALVSMAVWRQKGAKVAVPWFIFLFAIAMVINTYCGIPESISKGIVVAAKRGFAVTLFLVGTAFTPAALKSCGVKPLILGVTLWAIIGSLSLAVIKLAA